MSVTGSPHLTTLLACVGCTGELSEDQFVDAVRIAFPYSIAQHKARYLYRVGFDRRKELLVRAWVSSRGAQWRVYVCVWPSCNLDPCLHQADQLPEFVDSIKGWTSKMFVDVRYAHNAARAERRC